MPWSIGAWNGRWLQATWRPLTFQQTSIDDELQVMTDKLNTLSATRLVELYRAKQVSPVEVAKATLAAIERHNPALNAYCLVDPEAAITAAQESEQRWSKGTPLGPVDGVPTSIKDLVLTKGWPTRRGSRLVDPNQPWTEDAPCVARLRESGAVLLGKTTTPEFGWKGVTDSPLMGITRNPWNPEMTTGGSSGGAAAAAASHLGALHIGTDGGGSIRIPASFSGIVGFKQSFGRVPAYPLSPFGTLANAGPMTRTVADAALMLSVISRPDVRDWYALPPEHASYHEHLGGGVRGLRIAYSPTLSGASVNPEVAASVANAAKLFADLGAKVENVGVILGDSLKVFQDHWFPGAANALRAFNAEQRREIDPGLAYVAEQGAALPLMDYLAAVKLREAMGQKMAALHQKWDPLPTPTMPIPAFVAGRDFPADSDQAQWSDWTPFTYPFNLTRQPAISIPCGLTTTGLPIGLQIVGTIYDDLRVLRAARAFETVRPFRMLED